MSSRHPTDAAPVAGLSLGPDRFDAVVLLDGHPEPIDSPPAGPRELAALVRLIVQRARGRLEALTLDLSRVLDETVRAGAGHPSVLVIRIVPRAAQDAVLARSPAAVVEGLITDRFTVAGGHDLLGRELRPLDRAGLSTVCADLAGRDVAGVAIVGAGSQARPDHERMVAEAVQAALPGARISVASDFGGQGLVAREATVVLDCALGPPTQELIGRAEAALDRYAPGVPVRVARGDGGHNTAARVKVVPVVALGAFDALQLSGAAHLAGLADCRVFLNRPDGVVAGDVRHGLVAVRSGEATSLGVELVVPTAVLTPEPGNSQAEEWRRTADVPLVQPDRSPTELACIGAAVSRPTSWLDEFAFIESAAQLDRVRQEAQDRANAIVMANGAAPGSAVATEVSAVAVPYSPPGMVRIRVRVAGAPDTDPRRVMISDRMVP